MHPRLLRLAQLEVERTLHLLPPPIQSAANECLVTYESIHDALQQDPSLPDDVLGLFDGCDRLYSEPELPEEMPCIRLFLDSIWDYSEQNERLYRREIRTTYLHELGHYLGWGEKEVEALGLG